MSITVLEPGQEVYVCHDNRVKKVEIIKVVIVIDSSGIDNKYHVVEKQIRKLLELFFRKSEFILSQWKKENTQVRYSSKIINL